MGIAATILAFAAFTNPRTNIPLVSPAVCSIRGATWHEHQSFIDPPTGCYSRKAIEDFYGTESDDFDAQEEFVPEESNPDFQSESEENYEPLVPDVVGYYRSDADMELVEGWGLDATIVPTCDSNYGRGEVLDQEPAPGTPIEDFTSVTLYVNSARWIPDVIDRSEAEAIAKLEAKGFQGRIKYVDDDFVDAGIVTDQRKGGIDMGCPGDTDTLFVEINKGFEY